MNEFLTSMTVAPTNLAALWHALLMHTFDWQSELALQAKPRAHGEQMPPPQSTSVSAPFFIPSMQLAEETQISIALQKLEMQSESEKHIFPPLHFGHVPPPQSMSDSAPFSMLSEHVGLGVPDELLDELLEELLELELSPELELAEALSAQLPAPPSPSDVFNSGAQAAKSAEVPNAPAMTYNLRVLMIMAISWLR